MGNSNLPPGVSSNMIPGNRPQDEGAEKILLFLDDAAYHAVCWGWTEEQFLDEAKRTFAGSLKQMDETMKQLLDEPDPYDGFYEAEEE